MQVSNNNNYQMVSHSDMDSTEFEGSVVTSRNSTAVEENVEGAVEGSKEEEGQVDQHRCWVGICVGMIAGLALMVMILIVVYMVLDYYNKVPSWVVVPTVPLITRKKPQSQPYNMNSRTSTIPPPPNNANLTLLCSKTYMEYHSTNSCSSMCAPGICCFYKFQQGNCILNNLYACGLYAPCQTYYNDTTTTITTTTATNKNKTDGSINNETEVAVEPIIKHHGVCGRNNTNASTILCDPKLQSCTSDMDCSSTKQNTTANMKNMSWSYTQCVWDINDCSDHSPL